MTLTYNTLRPLVAALVLVLFATTFLQFASFLAVQEAQAQMVVTDPGNTITQWIIRALNAAWDVAKEAAKRAWEWTKDRALDALKWARDNALAILMAAGLKLAARFLLAEVERLMARRSIQSYLYYADFLVRNVYVIEQLTQRYPVRGPGGQYRPSDERDRLILFNLISEGRQLYSRLNPGTPAYEGIKQATLLNPRCQTYNLSPQNPNYYAELLASKGPECVPQFVIAGFRDMALNDLAAAENAAQQEIAAGEGFQSGRQCGTVATRDVFSPQFDGTSTTTTVNSNVVGDLTFNLPNVNQVRTGEEVEVLPTISSVLCTLITYPAGQTATIVNSMIDRIVNISTAPPQGVSQNTAAMRSFLSDTMATSVYRLLQSCNGNSVVRFIQNNTRLSSSCTQEDRNFVNQLPELNVENLETDIDLGTDSSFSVRDERRLNDYWRDMCETRLPLLYSLKNLSYLDVGSSVGARAKFNEIEPAAIQAGQIHRGSTQNDINRMYNFAGNSFRSTDGRGSETYEASEIEALLRLSTTTIETLINTQYITVYRNDDTGSRTMEDTAIRYKYLWQLLDPVTQLDAPDYYVKDAGGQGRSDDKSAEFSQWLALGRRYEMAIAGVPKAVDITAASNWRPNLWPYWSDNGGIGYVWPPFGVGDDKEKYVDRGLAKLYRVTSNGTTEYVSVPANGLQKLYEVANGELVFAWSQTPIVGSGAAATASANLQMKNGKLYKLNKSVSVTINNGQVQTNPNSYRSSGGDVFFVEYTDAQNVKKVLSATEITSQSPCYQQPYGPPANLRDVGPKLSYTRGISEALWNWIMQISLIRQNQPSF